jgi:hypothetical protein
MFVCVPEPVCQMRSGNSSLWKFTQIVVDQRRRLFQNGKSSDQLRRHAVFANREVVQRTLGLRSPVMVGWDRNLPHAIGLDTRVWLRFLYCLHVV